LSAMSRRRRSGGRRRPSPTCPTRNRARASGRVRCCHHWTSPREGAGAVSCHQWACPPLGPRRGPVPVVRGLGREEWACPAVGVGAVSCHRWACPLLGPRLGPVPVVRGLGREEWACPAGEGGHVHWRPGPPIIRPAAPRLESLSDLSSSNRRSPARFGGSAGPR
jgi:hypothetical protein